MLILAVFLLALATGVVSTAFWIPEEELGRGYFQTNALVVLGLLAILTTMVATTALTPWNGTIDGVWLVLGLMTSVAAYIGVWRQRWLAVRWISAACLAFLSIALWRADLAPRFEFSPQVAVRISLLLSALVLGWSLVTMLLGHWYLVAPKLNFRHLKRFCWVLAGLIALRTGTSLAAILAASQSADSQSWLALSSASGWGMFLWVRVLWGMVGALLLAAMALHCARRGSNQSATGILYVVVVSVWIGEASALFLQVMTGVPV